MNLIVERCPDIAWYSDLNPFVQALGALVGQYYWVFDDVDAMASFPPGAGQDGVWRLNGEQFKTMVTDRPQFVWAVVSAVATQDADSILLTGKRPSADGNPRFWTGSPKPQLPYASFELVCWDSSATLLIGAPSHITEAFTKAFPGALDLDKENAQRKQNP